jgi:hypothetical protein
VLLYGEAFANIVIKAVMKLFVVGNVVKVGLSSTIDGHRMFYRLTRFVVGVGGARCERWRLFGVAWCGRYLQQTNFLFLKV